MKKRKKNRIKYPAKYLVHWPGSSVYACESHARQLNALGGIMGGSPRSELCGPGNVCMNCVNEAGGS